ncbi:hypothetical protein DMUE_5498 [Dictyocoela muelleri]|nr:hypothetical protein DMUE_5498 [Dictyocoela muelleri]
MRYSVIKDEEEYKIILSIKKGENINEKIKDRHERSRYNEKAKQFILYNNNLYFLEKDRSLKEVIHSEDLLKMKNIVTSDHEIHHLGINKSEHYFNSSYYRIKRDVIHEVIKKCFKCSQTKPLKQKIPMKHIKAKNTRER